MALISWMKAKLRQRKERRAEKARLAGQLKRDWEQDEAGRRKSFEGGGG